MRAVSSEYEDLPELTVPEPAAAPPGPDVLAGLPGDRYRPVARLGAGAYGEVQRAHDRLLDRDVAIKRIRLENFVEPAHLDEVKKRLVREARVAARLRHRNIVTTHDIVSADDTSFIVMELVEGETLQSLLARRGRLGLDEATRILEQVAAALDHAHASGVVHRDVKPANVMIEPSGQVKVMDFGIAKLEEGANLTSTGAIMGTPNYMAPEQARGDAVDARSDLFSLGCVLYECLTGTRPFQSPSVSAILVKILTEDPPAVDPGALGLPGALEDVLARATAKDPSARYPSGAAMIAALRSLGSTTSGRPATSTLAFAAPPAAAPPTVVSPAARLPRRHGVRSLARVAAALVLAAAFVWIALALRSPRPLPGHTLVREEDVGTIGRLLRREPRLIVTVPAGTVLHLSVDAPLSSETAVTGDRFAAETSRAVRIEGVDAIPEGSRATGRVTHAASAEQAQGRGEMTLALDSVALADGGSVDVRAKPLGLRAPAAKKKEGSLVDSLSELGAAVGGLIGGRRGASAGMVVGGTAGAMVVTTSKGREVALGNGAPMSVELLVPVTVACPASYARSPERRSE
jgi:tRNA A-37 threonylcarbamoyl transferase component Bud32